MNCIEFEAALAGQRDASSPLSPEAIEHLSDCSECFQQWTLNPQMNTAIQAWRSVTDVPDLADRVLVELANSSEQPSTARLFDRSGTVTQPLRSGPSGDRNAVATGRGRLALFASIAACTIVVVAGLTQRGPQGGVELARQPNSRAAASPMESPLVEVSSSLSEVFSDLGSEYREIARETSLAARDLARVLPQVSDVTPRLDSSDESESETQGVSTDPSKIWRPISSRVETALGFLWQAIPQDVPAG